MRTLLDQICANVYKDTETKGGTLNIPEWFVQLTGARFYAVVAAATLLGITTIAWPSIDKAIEDYINKVVSTSQVVSIAQVSEISYRIERELAVAFSHLKELEQNGGYPVQRLTFLQAVYGESVPGGSEEYFSPSSLSNVKVSVIAQTPYSQESLIRNDWQRFRVSHDYVANVLTPLVEAEFGVILLQVDDLKPLSPLRILYEQQGTVSNVLLKVELQEEGKVYWVAAAFTERIDHIPPDALWQMRRVANQIMTDFDRLGIEHDLGYMPILD